MAEPVIHGLEDGEELAPCPFCAAGEFQIRETRLAPSMRGRGALISVEVHHWCARVPGVVRQSVTMAGTTREMAIAAWNRRASNVLEPASETG